MTEDRQARLNEMHLKLADGIELMKKRFGSPTEEYFEKLKEYGIECSEEKIIEDYAKFKDAEKLDEFYYEQYGDFLDSKQQDRWLNSDVFMELIDRIIPRYYDFEETGDPLFITEAIDELCAQDLRKADQREIEKIFRALVTHSKTRDRHTLAETLELYELNGLVSELVRVCHNRDAAFRALIKEMYECFEDMDPKIFPSVYKEVLKSKNR